MSEPDTLAFRMSNAAAARPPNPPPTICAFISPSLPAPANYSPVAPLTQAPTQFASGLLRYLVRPAGAVIAITQHPSCGIAKFRQTQDCGATDDGATMGGSTYCASRGIEQRKHADESDDSAAQRDLREARGA